MRVNKLEYDHKGLLFDEFFASINANHILVLIVSD